MHSSHSSLCQQFRSLSSQARASTDHVMFTICSKSPKTVLILLMHLNRSSGNHIPWIRGPRETKERRRHPITSGSAAGKFDIVFGRGEKHSCCWHLTIALLWMKDSDNIFLNKRKVGRWIWISMKSGTVPDTTSHTRGSINPFRNGPSGGRFSRDIKWHGDSK